MIKSYLNNIGWFVGLLLLQVLILNNLHIGGYATPFLYIYFILKLKTNMPRNRQLLYGFLLGLVVDMFANTPGVHTAATVFLAFVRTPYLNLFVAKDNTDPVNPAVGSIGVSPYLKYLAVSVFTHHIVVFC
ncbi:rod shape-determining protein MreD, partial [Bacteroides sp. OttesenSCG-928-E20]|nr:rod shape-determining protein MreD [Bacteroides sp. OttesenSCG-928-E20]